MVTTPRKFFKKAKDIVWASCKRKTWDHLVIHRRKLTEHPPSFIIPLLCGHVKGKLECPPEITIVLIHNYEFKTLMEICLPYVGIKNYVLLKPQIKGPWSHVVKLTTLLDYIKDIHKTDYLFYCDSNDAVLRDNPGKAINYLAEEQCDLLFSCTKAKGRYYKYMPRTKVWTDAIAQEKGFPGWYLNAGVFFGRTSFVQEVLETALSYALHSDQKSSVKKNEALLDGFTPELLHYFHSDQALLRYLHPRFYPRMKIDYQRRLALR